MLNVEQTMAFGVGKSATAVATAVKTEFGVTLPVNFFADMGHGSLSRLRANSDRWTAPGASRGA
jgi:hypothetical protein